MENSDIIQKTLQILSSGECKSTVELRRMLNIDETLLESILGLLISEGLIEEVKYVQCSRCSIEGSCPIALRRKSRSIGMYRLSSKGLKTYRRP